MNPVLKRELVVRWRGHAVWLLFAAIALLALVVWTTYSNQVARQEWSDSGIVQMPRIGRQLFQMLAVFQVLGWVLLAPALTSTAISGERERGLLDALRLSRLSSARIVWGKLGGALFFVLQIAMGVLPLIAICFLMGGVAPAEFVLAAWLQLVTAVCGLCIGLYFSAINRRSSGAIVATMVFSIAWFFASLFAAITADTASRFTNWATPIYKPLWLFGLFNPFFLTANSLERSSGVVVSPVAPIPDWVLGSALQLSFAALLLWGAIRAVQHPQESEEIAAKKSRRRFLSRRENGEETPREYSHPKTARTHWNLLPSSRTRGLNPLLRRELHARLRLPLPRGSWRIWALLGIAALLGGFALLWRSFWMGEVAAKEIWSFTISFGTIGLALAATVIGAISLARERENGTWEMLQLSLLSPAKCCARSSFRLSSRAAFIR